MFGERLKNILQDREISQLKLAQELGYTQQAVNRWCNNITEPDNKTIVFIANYLNVSTDYLLGNIPKKTEEEEIEILRQLLIKNGYMKKEEDLTKKELDNLIKMAKNNKNFLKGEK